MGDNQNIVEGKDEDSPVEELNDTSEMNPEPDLKNKNEPVPVVKKKGIKSFFSRGSSSSKGPSSDLNEFATEADRVSARLDQVEGQIGEIVRAQVSLDKKLGKELARVVKEIGKSQSYHERSIERILESLRSDVAAQSTSAHQFHTIALSKVDTAVGAVSGVNSSLSGIRGFLDENSRMIKRFEEGYDYQILKNFVRQIARSIKNLEKQISKVGEGDSREELIDARDDLVEMFERNGISPIRPSVGDVYVGMEQFVEVSNDKIQTSDPSLKGKIAEVESAGYLYDFNDGQQRLIQAARVKLYE